jgi:hypothetical protein
LAKILVFGETNLTRRPFLFSIVKVRPCARKGCQGIGKEKEPKVG